MNKQEKMPVATIHVDGSFVHVEWKDTAPNECHMDVYAALSEDRVVAESVAHFGTGAPTTPRDMYDVLGSLIGGVDAPMRGDAGYTPVTVRDHTAPPDSAPNGEAVREALARLRKLKTKRSAPIEDGKRLVGWVIDDDSYDHLFDAISDISTIEDFISITAPVASVGEDDFQSRVQPWMTACFGPEISRDKIERNHRFIEEALELVQANGCTAGEAHQLVDYVYGRPVGEIKQEVGGVMVTLAALCLANDLDMHICGETELARVWTKVEQIRAKQAAKPKHSPLPGPSDPTPQDAKADAGEEHGWLIEWKADDEVQFPRWWHPSKGWRVNANEAIRYARKQDAEAGIAEWKIQGNATEHLWVSPLRTLPPSASKPGTVEGIARIIEPALFRCYDDELQKGRKSANGRLWADVVYGPACDAIREKITAILALINARTSGCCK